MYRIYRWLYNLVGFSRSQSNAFIILLPLMALFLFSEPVYRRLQTSSPSDYVSDIKRLDSLLALFPPPESTKEVFVQAKPVKKLFLFDPNKVQSGDFEKLGFEPELARRILKYRGKGGVFRTKKDLLRIHGLSPDLFRRISGFITLPDSLPPKKTFEKDISRPLILIDINVADTTELKTIRGIGSKISQRILKYRESLGGFYQVSQLLEVYQLDSAVAERLIKVSFINPVFSVRRLNINKADKKTLAIHPYISTPAATAIVTHRLKYGDFHVVEDIRKISQVDSITFERVKPYLTVTD